MQILIVIITVIMLLLFISITLCVTINDENELSIKYGLFKFKINLNKDDIKEKTKKEVIEKEPKKKVKKLKEVEETEEEVKESLTEKIQKLKDLFKYVNPVTKQIKIGLIKILKCIKFKNVKIIMFVASEDAHITAINYVKTSTVISNIVSILQIYSSIQIKEVKINADFVSELSSIDIYFEVKFRLLFLIGNILKMITNIIVAIIKVTLNNKK